MKILIVSFALAAAAIAGQASAQAAVTATLQTPLAKHAQFVKGDTAWVCGDSQCQASVVSTETDTWQSCKQLVRTVGAVTAYGTLDAKALAKCNAEAASK